MHRYVFYLTLRNANFVVSDMIALAKILNIEMEFEDKTLKIGESPDSYFIVLLFKSDDDAIRFASRSIVTRAVAKLFCDGPDFESMIKLAESVQHNINSGSFAVRIESFGGRISKDQRLIYIERIITTLGINSAVDLVNPKNTILLYVRMIPEQKSSISSERYYLGVEIAKGAFEMPEKYTLRERRFINKTSMEESVALHACIQCLAAPGKIIYDPFVGSGSLLIAAASLGAYTIGSDFDMKSMTQHGPDKKDDVSIPSNFAQYGLSHLFLGVFRLDFLSDNICYKKMPKLDAIVTDPPYGIREKQRSDGKSPLLPLLLRLYEVAAVCLKVGGRLVYWLPTGYDYDAENDLPKHPSLKLISDCQQVLMTRYCRHLLTFVKTHEDENAKVEFTLKNQSFLRVRALVHSDRSNPEGYLRRESARDRKRQKKALKKQEKLLQTKDSQIHEQ